MVIAESLQETIIALSNGTIDDALRPPLPQKWRSLLHPSLCRMAISPQRPQRVIRSTSCLVLVYGFRGQRIEWRYLRFDETQDGGHGMTHDIDKR